MESAKDPPRISWLRAKQLLFPRVLKSLESIYEVHDLEVIDIVGEGFPEPENAVIQDRTNGWSVYYNNLMKLHPIIRLTVNGEKKRIKIPSVINAVLNYDEKGDIWECTSFQLLKIN